MGAFEFPETITPDFHIRSSESPGAWAVRCSGILDVPDAAAHVQPHLLGLHSAVVAAKIPLVRLDVTDVEYMNSSGLKSFMAWFLIASQSKDHQYTIEVGYDPHRSWQQVSLRPMERLAPKVVRLKPAPAAG
ncbi:MAG: hypothetical protein HYZ28_21690 [Myxococcales bacterium]|nr:hypothetical protein [Myxococcales bacterium]